MIPHDICIGDTVSKHIEALNRSATGTVVYIHPLRRFYTARFSFGNAAFLESFKS